MFALEHVLRGARYIKDCTPIRDAIMIMSIMAFCIATTWIMLTAFMANAATPANSWQGDETSIHFAAARGKTLVVYVFSDTDPEYLENLKFFVQYGVSTLDTSAEFVIILQTDVHATVSYIGYLPTPAVLHFRS